MGHFGHGASSQTILFCKFNDAPAFRCLVRQRSQLGYVGHFIYLHSCSGQEFHSLPIPKGNRACLVQEQDIYVASRFGCPTAHSKNILLN